MTLLQQSPTWLITLVTLVGLLVGSFLNVVIYRLPLMMQRSWHSDCIEFLLQTTSSEESLTLHSALLTAQTKLQSLATMNLMLPASRCGHCQTPIKAYHNIPVLSYLLLRGKCAACGGAIALRYPAVEAFTALCSAIVAWQIGYAAILPWALVLTWALIALSLIDFDQQLLPDSITLPLLWLGLLLSEWGLFTTPDSSIFGAAAGYLSLWLVYQGFKLLTGKEGMGYGDFKLLAVFGAWLGWQFLPLIVLVSSLTGAIAGIILVFFAGRDHQVPMPFGPYLAAAGWIALLWGPKFNGWYLAVVGL